MMNDEHFVEVTVGSSFIVHRLFFVFCPVYAVKLTDEGREVAQKRVAANDKTADDIIGCLSEEEIAQLNAITEKLILSMKDKGINGKKKGRKAHECCCR